MPDEVQAPKEGAGLTSVDDGANSTSFIQLHLSQTDQSEIQLQHALDNMRSVGYHDEEEEGLTLRKKNLPELKASSRQKSSSRQKNSARSSLQIGLNSLAKSERSLIELDRAKKLVKSNRNTVTAAPADSHAQHGSGTSHAKALRQVNLARSFRLGKDSSQHMSMDLRKSRKLPATSSEAHFQTVA